MPARDLLVCLHVGIYRSTAAGNVEGATDLCVASIQLLSDLYWRLFTEPNAFVAEVHDRMPVVLEANDFAAWLDEGGHALLKPAGNDVLRRWPVSTRVNSSRAPADDPSLIDRNETS